MGGENIQRYDVMSSVRLIVKPSTFNLRHYIVCIHGAVVMNDPDLTLSPEARFIHKRNYTKVCEIII